MCLGGLQKMYGEHKRRISQTISRLAILLLIIMMCTTLARCQTRPVSASTLSQVEPYDLNGNGIVTSTDLDLYRRNRTDLNGDGVIDIFDYVLIARECVDSGALVPGR